MGATDHNLTTRHGCTSAVMMESEAPHHKIAEPAWERCVADPGEPPEDELVTHIFYPLK